MPKESDAMQMLTIPWWETCLTALESHPGVENAEKWPPGYRLTLSLPRNVRNCKLSSGWGHANLDVPLAGTPIPSTSASELLQYVHCPCRPRRRPQSLESLLLGVLQRLLPTGVLAEKGPGHMAPRDSVPFSSPKFQAQESDSPISPQMLS
jgi:hypothetical protein